MYPCAAALKGGRRLLFKHIICERLLRTLAQCKWCLQTWSHVAPARLHLGTFMADTGAGGGQDHRLLADGRCHVRQHVPGQAITCSRPRHRAAQDGERWRRLEYSSPSDLPTSTPGLRALL